MQMQFIVSLAVAIGPAAAAFYNDGRRPKYGFQDCASLLWPRVALNGERQTFDDILLAPGPC
jgi:hypothetical protein